MVERVVQHRAAAMRKVSFGPRLHVFVIGKRLAHDRAASRGQFRERQIRRVVDSPHSHVIKVRGCTRPTPKADLAGVELRVVDLEQGPAI